MCDLVRDAVRISPKSLVSIRFSSFFVVFTALITVYILDTNSQHRLDNIRCSQPLAHL